MIIVSRHDGNVYSTAVALAIVTPAAADDIGDTNENDRMIKARAAIMAHQELWRDVMRVPARRVNPKHLVVCHLANATSILTELKHPPETRVLPGTCSTNLQRANTSRVKCSVMSYVTYIF